MEELRGKFDELGKLTNELSASLNSDQAKARKALRLHDVATFLSEVGYESLNKTITDRDADVDESEKALGEATGKVGRHKEAISRLKSQMQDERNGAEKVNGYLQHHFGHSSLSLHAVSKEGEDQGSDNKYRFEIRRGDERAYHLSEGERGLLAFCYFMARLGDVNTVGTKPIIWIDDPISSLDENHIFFVYSLIRTQIIETQLSSQLFISTHSLAFLKYLKRVSGQVKLERAYFLVDRSGVQSTIKLMPKHLKDYATEFHYLFHRIFRCAHAECADNADDFYDFGNNARKFLEMYLYFRYPDASHDSKGQESKLHRFLGKDGLAATVGERIENEYSHLSGLFERGMIPVDVPAMKSMAQLILSKIREYDSDQYTALLSSVGEVNAEKNNGTV